MIYKLSTDSVEPFARHVLGCTCPDEVFSQIRSSVEWLGEVPYQRIEIGGRLLIYLVVGESEQTLVDVLPELMRRGLEERNLGDLNRLRMVMIASQGGKLYQQLVSQFNQHKAGDLKVHLHLFDELPRF